MLNSIQKNIIIRATIIRMKNGEKAEAVLKSYTRLTEDEKTSILKEIRDSQI